MLKNTQSRIVCIIVYKSNSEVVGSGHIPGISRSRAVISAVLRKERQKMPWRKLYNGRNANEIWGTNLRNISSFRKSYISTDHIQTLYLVIEKKNRVQQSLFIFHLFSQGVRLYWNMILLRSMDRTRIDFWYSKILENFYRNAFFCVTINRW